MKKLVFAIMFAAFATTIGCNKEPTHNAAPVALAPSSSVNAMPSPVVTQPVVIATSRVVPNEPRQVAQQDVVLPPIPNPDGKGCTIIIHEDTRDTGGDHKLYLNKLKDGTYGMGFEAPAPISFNDGQTFDYEIGNRYTEIDMNGFDGAFQGWIQHNGYIVGSVDEGFLSKMAEFQYLNVDTNPLNHGKQLKEDLVANYDLTGLAQALGQFDACLNS